MSRGVQRYTGINLLTSFIASRIATFVLHHQIGGKVAVTVCTYSLTDLIAGKIRSVKVSLRGSSYKGIPLGQIRASTVSPVSVRYLRKDREMPGVRIPLLVRIEGSISQEELGRALESADVSSQLKMVKLDLPGLGEQQLQLLDPKVEFENGLVKVKTLLVTKGANREAGVSLSVSGKPVLKDDSRIILEDMQVESPDIISPDEFSPFLESLLNPLIDFRKMDRIDHAFRLPVLKIGNEKIDFGGNLLLAPRVHNAQLAQRVLTRQ